MHKIVESIAGWNFGTESEWCLGSGRRRGPTERKLLGSQTSRLRLSITFVAAVLLTMLSGMSCSRHDNDSTPAKAKGRGRVTIVYQDDAILPENRDAIKKIRDSGVFERMADRLTKTVALPHDLQVIVTDKTPKGIDDPSEIDGTILLAGGLFQGDSRRAR